MIIGHGWIYKLDSISSRQKVSSFLGNIDRDLFDTRLIRQLCDRDWGPEPSVGKSRMTELLSSGWQSSTMRRSAVTAMSMPIVWCWLLRVCSGLGGQASLDPGPPHTGPGPFGSVPVRVIFGTGKFLMVRWTHTVGPMAETSMVVVKH